LLYDLIAQKDNKTFNLMLNRIVYTNFKDALEQIAKFEAGPIKDFAELLQKKLDAKRIGNTNTDSESIVVE